MDPTPSAARALSAFIRLERLFRRGRDGTAHVASTCRCLTEELGFASARVDPGADADAGPVEPGAASWPLRADGRAVGVLHVTWPPESPPEPALMELGPALAEALAHALVQAELPPPGRAEALLEAHVNLTRLAASGSLDDVLQFALETAERLTESRLGFFHFVDEAGGALQLQAWSGGTSSAVRTERGQRRLVDAEVWAEAARGRRPVIRNHPHRPGGDALAPQAAPWARELVVPILRGEQVVALMGVGDKAADYTAGDAAALGTLADLVTDTVGRKRAEARLAASEARYRSLVENLEDIVYSVDPAGRLEYVSAAVAHLGYTPEDVLGQPLEVLVHPEDRDQVADWSGAPERLTQELRVVDWTGAVRIVRHARRALEGDGGGAVGYVGVLTDLTQQRQTEDALRLAQKMEAIGRLAGGVAHDFNNLLSVILSLTAFVLEDLPEAHEHRADLQDILHAGERAATLTRQLLAFSRRQVLQPRVVSLNRVVLDMQAILRRLIGEDIHLISYLSDDEPRARVDVGQLEQVVLNLAVNARDAMPQGGRLTLETAIAEVTGDESDLQLTVAPGRYVLLRMTDTGVGMDDAILSRIFEPFFTTKGQGKGTGLGLATVYGIVSQSGGGVVVRSRPQLGTTFEVYLPQVTAPEELEPASSRAPAPALTAAAPRTVLVVEDDDRVRAVAERVVHLTGCQPLAAPDGHTALTLAERHGPELALVLTDVKMPSMSGHELVRRLREAAPQLPVVFMSGYAQELLDSVDLMDGLTRFIAKPFTPGQLAQCIQEALGQPLRGSAARSS